MKQLTLVIVLISMFLLAAPYAPATETFPARVVGVVDGDSLRVSRKEGATIKVRLFGIDCPEKGQKYGKEARGSEAHHPFRGRVMNRLLWKRPPA